MRQLQATIVLAALMILGSAAHTHAGPVDPPPGPVSPTMKTLEQVEPRVAVNAENTPGAGIVLYRISEPGSYYLTDDVIGAGVGIEIAAPRVTLDLNGFAVVGGPGTQHGIDFAGTVSSVTVRNGSIRGWSTTGVRLQSAADMRSVILENLHISENGVGVRVGANAIIRSCSVFDNTLSGIISTGNTVIEDTAVLDNGDDGITMLFGGTVRNCTIRGNTGYGIDLSGTAVRVTDCSILLNGGGVRSVSRAMITGCAINGNTDDGVNLTGGHNTLRDNSIADNGVGIRVLSENNRIEGNSINANTSGVLVFEPGNFIARNTVTDSPSGNWAVAAGNICFVVQATTSGVIAGNSGGVSPGSTNPNANFTY